MASLQAYTGPLDKRLAAHLLRRTTYVSSKEQIDQFTNMSVSDAVDSLFVLPPLTIPEPIDWLTNQPWINSGVEPLLDSTEQMNAVTGWWLNEAMQDTGISHRLMVFLHQNFVVSAAENMDSREHFDYLTLIRQYCFGSYREFSKKMTLDNSMLDYLDGEDNLKNSPNENYAREFFELFTIYKGPQIGPEDYTNYTETDIVQAAKLLTGWKKVDRTLPANPLYIDPDTGLQAGYPDYSKHDVSAKTFTAAFGGQTIAGATSAQDMYRELDDFVNMVFDQDETAKSLCRRLYRYFVHTNITTEIEDDIITPLAVIMKNSDYNMEITLKELLKSQHFYDKDDTNANNQIIGGLLRNPLELLGQVMGFFKMDVIDPYAQPKAHYETWWKNSVIDSLFLLAGFELFEPAQVAGYPGYYQEPSLDRNWLGTSTLLARYKLPEVLISGNRLFSNNGIGNGRLDTVKFLTDKGVISNNFDAFTIVDELTSYLFPEPLTPERFDYYLNDVFLNGFPAFDWTEDWIDFLNTGDDSAVKIPLGNLITTILYSQDFQVM